MFESSKEVNLDIKRNEIIYHDQIDEWDEITQVHYQLHLTVQKQLKSLYLLNQIHTSIIKLKSLIQRKQLTPLSTLL